MMEKQQLEQTKKKEEEDREKNIKKVVEELNDFYNFCKRIYKKYSTLNDAWNLVIRSYGASTPITNSNISGWVTALGNLKKDDWVKDEHINTIIDVIKEKSYLLSIDKNKKIDVLNEIIKNDSYDSILKFWFYVSTQYVQFKNIYEILNKNLKTLNININKTGYINRTKIIDWIFDKSDWTIRELDKKTYTRQNRFVKLDDVLIEIALYLYTFYIKNVI